MPQAPVQTQSIDRNELARFLPEKAFRLIKAFENLFQDVSKTIPDAIGQAVQGPSGGAVDDNVVVFDGSAGFLVKDSGVSIDDLAPLESPEFTGTPKAPTASPGTSTTQIATTAFVASETDDAVDGPATATDSAIVLFDGTSGKLVKDSATSLSSLAPLASPALTGNPTAPTAALGDADTSIATTAFVQNAINNLATGASSFSAHNNGVAQSIPNNAFTKLTLSTEEFDVGSKFSASTWTPPAGRLVMLSGAMTTTGAAGAAVSVAIFKNGAQFKRGVMQMPQGAGPTLSTVSCIDIPNGTDTYEIWGFQNTGVAQNTFGGSTLTYFQGTTIQA